LSAAPKKWAGSAGGAAPGLASSKAASGKSLQLGAQLVGARVTGMLGLSVSISGLSNAPPPALPLAPD
jgi:hypothetical protein